MKPEDAKTIDILRRSSDGLHRIAGAIYTRKTKASPRWNKLTEPLKAGLLKNEMTDEEIESLAVDLFEEIVVELVRLGDPTATICECGKDDITP